MAKLPRGIEIVPKVSRVAARVLTSDALQFVAELQRGAKSALEQLRLQRIARTGLPDFNPRTSAIRASPWKAAALPRELADLRSGVVTAASRKELLMALNSGARLCLADFADFTSPGFDTLIDGHINLMDRWTSAMEHTDRATGRRMSLSQRLASLMVQPRNLTAPEPRVLCDGKPVAAALFDAGLYLLHNAKVALAKASGPYLQLTGIASQAEARAWNDILLHVQSLLGLPAGSIRVHVRIDHVQAAFEIDEIAYELRDHIAGLTPGGASFAFDIVRHLTDRTQLAFDGGGALSDIVIYTAHRRGLLAMAPLDRTSPHALAESAVRSGFDGLWTADPAHVLPVLKIFNQDMPTANQIYVIRDDAAGRHNDLLSAAGAAISEDRVRRNIAASLAALESWLSGGGPVMADDTIADRASVDLMRAELWHWLKAGTRFEGGVKFTPAVFEAMLAECYNAFKSREGRFKDAAKLLKAMVTAKDLPPDLFALTWKKLA